METKIERRDFLKLGMAGAAGSPALRINHARVLS
jgi:hypothetical protein